MASTYKTPGVYVEEITKFPPSVASVETAIPAFIGYTEKAEKNGESLKNIPKSIDSFLEFEQYFGGPPPRDVIVRLTAANQYLRTERKGTMYLLYDSVRLFYDNGGGVCYIVSVDNYTKAPEIGDNTKGLLGGLKALEKYDEPTLIVSPDSVSLNPATDLYTFQQQAINQCNKLQDRFLICDLLKNDETAAGETFEDRVAGFRNNIGINYLKYAAAYVPWLRTSLPAGLRFRDIIFALNGDPAPTAATSLALLTSLTTNPAILQLIFDLSNAIKAVDLIKSKLVPGGAGSLLDVNVSELDGQLNKLLKLYVKDYNDAAVVTFANHMVNLKPIYNKILEILDTIISIQATLPNVVAALMAPSVAQSVEFKLKSDIENSKNDFKAVLSSLATHHFELLNKGGVGTELLLAADPKVVNILAYTGLTLPTVPKNASVQALYRSLAVKIIMLAKLKAIITLLPAGTAGPATFAVLDAAIPTAATLKADVDAQIAAVKGASANLAALPASFAAAIVAAPNDRAKMVLHIAQAFVEDDNAINNPPDLLSVVNTMPLSIANDLNQALSKTKQLASAAAAVPGSTRPNIETAIDFNPSKPKEYTLIASSAASGAGGQAAGLFNTILNGATTYENIFDQSLLQSFGLYKTLVTKAGQDLMILPPGAAVAGVYASVDSNRGVWKAPANASLASVLAPYFLISAQEQESLNVDTNAGKSINAIRAFTGRGTLVWGTRTLAGNDNEWRYVPVRRYFNYAEESIKKATEPFVFEPNDLNTWVRVKAMTENFLTLEWRRGALAGAKPADAFYVKVGLGETMTSLDILEGRMIVEIGLAVVRPAEFIILRFSHKMQES